MSRCATQIFKSQKMSMSINPYTVILACIFTGYSVQTSGETRITQPVLYLIITMWYYSSKLNTESLLMLSQVSQVSDAALVCLGGNLTFICRTNESFLFWNVTTFFPNGSVHTRDRLVTTVFTVDQFDFKSQGIEDSHATILRTSPPGIPPLISTLSIINISSIFNGTLVNCTDVGPAAETQILTVRVIRTQTAYIHSPKLSTTVSHYGSDNVTVTLEWLPELEVEVSYDISVIPAPLDGSMFNRTSLQTTVSYNTLYNVSVVASHCHLQNTTTIQFKFAKCSYPELQSVGINGSIRVKIERVPALEGKNITFSCPPDLVLTGPNSSTCMENGEWEPDPREVECKAKCQLVNTTEYLKIMSNTDEPIPAGSVLKYWCKEFPNDVKTSLCDENGTWDPPPNAHNMCTKLSSDGEQILTVIIPVIIGSLIGVILIIACIILLITMQVKKRGSRKERTITNSGPINYEDQLMNQNFSVGEYSLLQHSPTLTTTQTTSMDDKDQRQNLVYADIGPLALRKRPCVPSLAIDDKVEYSQLNYTPNTKINVSIHTEKREDLHSPDKLLNLDSLLIQLKDLVTPKWYEFGEALRIEKAVLDKCTQYPPEQSIIEVLDNWLRCHPGQPSWREVAKCLKTIGIHELAADLEGVYETGKLPKDIINEIPQELLSGFADHDSPPPIPPRTMDI